MEKMVALLLHTTKSNRILSATRKFHPVFFDLPDSEHISAVIFTNSGTHAKFQRMGYQAGFSGDEVEIGRYGFAYNPDPAAMDSSWFSYSMSALPVEETWGQGISVFFNPNALHPIKKDFFPNGTQSYIEDGQLMTDMFGFHPFQSQKVVTFTKDKKKGQRWPKFAVHAIGFETYQELAGRYAFVSGKNPILLETGWFVDESGTMAGAVSFDKIDNDWAFATLQLVNGRLELVDMKVSISTRTEAVVALQMSMSRNYLKSNGGMSDFSRLVMFGVDELQSKASYADQSGEAESP